MFRSLKGQAAIEYLGVFGIALALSTPFIIEAQESVLDLRAGSNLMDARSSIERISSSAEVVNAAGEPAKRTFPVRLPENLREARVSGKSVVLTLETPDSTFNVSESFDFNTTGDLPDDGGRYIVAATALDDEVKIEVVE